MSRIYEVSFEGILVAAVQDMVAIIGATGKLLRIKRVKWGCTNTTLATGQNLSTRCRILPATYTTGSGGSAATPQKTDPGDAAATFTARVNDTVKATTSGTAQTEDEDGSHLFAGYNFSFPNPPIIGPTAGFVFELLSTVSGTINLSGLVEVEENG